MSLRQKNIVIIDIETTGLDEQIHEIIEFAGLCLSSGELLHLKIKPNNINTADPLSLSINNYNERNWKNALSQKEALEKINLFLKNKIYLGQNVNFDLKFIKKGLNKYGIESNLGRRHIDTMTLAYEHLVPLGLESLSLRSICNFIGINNEGEHTAVADVMRTKNVYLSLDKASWLSKRKWRARFILKRIIQILKWRK